LQLLSKLKQTGITSSRACELQMRHAKKTLALLAILFFQFTTAAAPLLCVTTSMVLK